MSEHDAVTGPQQHGDRPGCLVDGTTGEVIYQHFSSSKCWALQDVTTSFGRKYELERRYPEGYRVVELDSWNDAPEDVRQRNDEWARAHRDAPTEEPQA